MLVRNTTWTASRDGTEGATFLHPIFYDGQGMMVAADSGYASIDDMDGAIVCVADGTTTEGNVATEFDRSRPHGRRRSRSTDIDLLQEAFDRRLDATAGRPTPASSTPCAATTRDGADALTILAEVFSKEPLAPAVRRRRQPLGAGRRTGRSSPRSRPRSSA